jgi:hypothetical protein
MKKYFALLAIVLFVFGIKAQNAADANLSELAKATLKAHGGEKLTKAKTIVWRGSAEFSVSGAPQAMPASFALVLAGDKYRFDIQGFGFNFQQISDGINTSSSMPGITLPPMNLVGLNMLPKIETDGFIVSALPEKLKKKKGFRLTSPEGYYTDFIVDEKTFQVKEYESSYEYNGNTVSTSVAINKYKDFDGILINEKYSQRLDLGSITAYANFNAKDILINSEVTDDVFTIK